MKLQASMMWLLTPSSPYEGLIVLHISNISGPTAPQCLQASAQGLCTLTTNAT